MTPPDMAGSSLIGRGPHLVRIVTPVISADRYGAGRRDYGPAAARRTVRGWLQLKTSQDLDAPERPAGSDGDWTFYTHSAIAESERIEYDGRTWLIDGQVYPASSPAGTHHYRARLRLVVG